MTTLDPRDAPATPPWLWQRYLATARRPLGQSVVAPTPSSGLVIRTTVQDGLRYIDDPQALRAIVEELTTTLVFSEAAQDTYERYVVYVGLPGAPTEPEGGWWSESLGFGAVVLLDTTSVSAGGMRFYETVNPAFIAENASEGGPLAVADFRSSGPLQEASKLVEAAAAPPAPTLRELRPDLSPRELLARTSPPEPATAETAGGRLLVYGAIALVAAGALYYAYR